MRVATFSNTVKFLQLAGKGNFARNLLTNYNRNIQLGTLPKIVFVRSYVTMSSSGESSSIPELPLILRLVNESSIIANTAAGIVRRVLKSGDLDVIDKGIDDLQTKADRAAQTYIVTRLHQLFPKATIIGEEGDNISEAYDELISPTTSPSKSPFPEILSKSVPENLLSMLEENVVIWVDPLDGTREFTKGLVTHVTILIGIAYNGKPVGGVVNQPFYDSGKEKPGRTIYGIPDVGFGGLNLISAPDNKRIITTTRSHSNERVEAALAALKPDDILRVGGAGHKSLLLMEGKAHAYVFASQGCKKWDTCAPEAVLRAMGGKLTDMDGNDYKYTKDVEHVNVGGLLATAPGQDHEWYVKTIPK